MKNDDTLITYAAIEDQVRRARLQRSIYLAEAIATAAHALLQLPSRLLARLEGAREEAPRFSATRRLSPR